MNELRDKLLREDGIDPAATSEQELARFRILLAEEQKRARRLGWMIQIALAGEVLLLLGVCVGEGLWDRLHVPFLAASGAVVIVTWLAILGFSNPLARRLVRTQRRVRQLKERLPEHTGVRPRGIPLLAREGRQTLVFWPGVLLTIVLVGVIATVVGNGIWILMTGRLPGFVTAWQIVLGLLVAGGIVRHGLTRPAEELPEMESPNRLFWLPVPHVLTLRVPRAVRITSLTGLLILVGVVAVVSFLQSGTVYAKALNSLRQAPRIHAVGYGFHAGRPVKESEIWHVRGVGTKTQWLHGGQTIEIYDDGRDRYRYVQGGSHAVKRQGQGELLPRELVEPLHYLKDARRDPSQDRVIDGDRCQSYRREDPNTLAWMWIDEAMRFRRYEEFRRVEDQWQREELIEIRYDEEFDLAMPPGTFEQRGIEIVEPARVLETRYGLEDAIARAELLGLVFAVHELYRCGEYLILASSVRATEQSLADLAAASPQTSVADTTSYGGFDLTSWWQRNADGSIEERPYAIRQLGHLSHQGVDLYWHALLPRGAWPGQRERLEVCAYVRTDGAFRQLRQRQGLDWRGQFRPLLTVDLPASSSGLTSVASDLCEVGHLVTAASRAAQDLFVSETSDVTAEQFQRRFESLLTGLRPMAEIWDRIDSDLHLELIDEKGAPVAGAWLASRVRYANGTIHPEPSGPDRPVLLSDARGQVSIAGSQLFSRDSSRDARAMLYAFDPERQLAACYAVGGSDFGGPVRVTMRPARRARMSFAEPQQGDDTGFVIQVDVRMSVPREFSQNSILLHVLNVITRERFLEIPLPPGEYALSCHGTRDGADLSAWRHFIIPAQGRDPDLGAIELR